MGKFDNANIKARISKGWRPSQYLTNMSLASFSSADDFVARKMFPICPVALSSASYYIFDKADLARDNVQRKPQFGKVTPAVMGQSEGIYNCKVDQIIVGIDQLAALNYSRTNAPGVADPRRAKVRFAQEQMDIHLDRVFAEKFFKTGVWSNEWSGVASAANEENKTMLKWDDANFDPVAFIDARKTEFKKKGRRRPNRLGLGAGAYEALKNNPNILEKIKYTGSSANPAVVNEKVLQELFGIETVCVLESTYNAGGYGKEDMKYICDENSALLAYATASPQIDEPSAGYIFAWDMLGNGNWTAFDQYEGENGTHTEFIEGLLSNDMKKTSDDLGIFFRDCR